MNVYYQKIYIRGVFKNTFRTMGSFCYIYFSNQMANQPALYTVVKLNEWKKLNIRHANNPIKRGASNGAGL